MQYSLDALVANSDSAGIILDVRQDIHKAYVCDVYKIYTVGKNRLCINFRTHFN